ncbi:MAG: hypothetical protein A3A61_04220 [Candidatus Woykebacteria bacterium RIFCSPLOWO2_01_FULL_43_14]|uniref:HMA domain-containing protein n=2 Tax=Candidatus Woykeibacteriota TaxID=1817899 RepID=A0A1G1WX47_9BACT|nr:MAG: hypothetical protein A3J50_03215 [Candidatus Woykebacteria bacterium RIFCSPHIGHO2_02_FULL_43_16b]OGY32264.1 MAG: hypothetical protein A3A61_04220 [Candidatus Woykebacteria bacterium RIFCSPLOWO2_01_FULL_43_14]
MITKQIFKIEGMHCTSCSLLIEGDLEDLNGVLNAQANYVRSECLVEFDDEQLNTEVIIGTVAQIGYKLQPLT